MNQISIERVSMRELSHGVVVFASHHRDFGTRHTHHDACLKTSQFLAGLGYREAAIEVAREAIVGKASRDNYSAILRQQAIKPDNPAQDRRVKAIVRLAQARTRRFGENEHLTACLTASRFLSITGFNDAAFNVIAANSPTAETVNRLVTISQRMREESQSSHMAPQVMNVLERFGRSGFDDRVICEWVCWAKKLGRGRNRAALQDAARTVVIHRQHGSLFSREAMAHS